MLVGLCNSPQYLNVQRGTSSLGNGTVSGFLFLTEAGYDTDYFTELYLTVDNDDDAFSEAYAAAMDAWRHPSPMPWSCGGSPDGIRSSKTPRRSSATAGRNTTTASRNMRTPAPTTDQELADAKQELDDALQELQDGEADYAEGVETAIGAPGRPHEQ